MTHMLQLLPALLCVALMFGAGALTWVARKTRLARVAWLPSRVRARSGDAADPRG
jgi:hypothetical protein